MELAVKQLETTKDQFTRLSAEYDNYRKRTTKEKDNIYQDAKADTVEAFLDVYDNLVRAVATPGGEDSPHKKGLEMIFQQLFRPPLHFYQPHQQPLRSAQQQLGQPLQKQERLSY